MHAQEPGQKIERWYSRGECKIQIVLHIQNQGLSNCFRGETIYYIYEMNLKTEQRVELVAYRQEFERELHNILNYWKKFAPDNASGGFHGAVNLQNVPIPEAPRSCVLNARILWTFSEAARNFEGRGYVEIAHRAYKVISDHFFDYDYQGFYMELDAHHKPLNSVKHTYVQAFVLYALAKYYELTNSPQVMEQIQSFFLFLDAKAVDLSGPGYLEGFSREWELIQNNRMADNNEPKSMNTHLHLLEAYAAVLKVWPDELVREKLSYLLDLFSEKIIRKDGHLGIFFDQEFEETESSKGICSFGHDIEASWLILDALEILGDWERKDFMEPILIQMAKNVYREGVDHDGGLFLESTRFGSHLRTNKHWWLQAELLVGEMNSFSQTGTIQYWNLLKRTWKFITNHLIDHTGGEWFTKLNRMGVPYLSEPENDPSPYYRNDWKIDPWKCPYHNGRAMMELIFRIDKLLQ